MSLRLAAAVTMLVVVLAGCGGDDEVAGGSDDLPEPVPAGVTFELPADGLAAPDFTAELLDGTEVTASELWRDRPLVLVFTASWCERCRDVHREAARVVDEHPGAALLGVVGEDDVDGGGEYADELDLGHAVAVAPEDVWLSYAAREPPVVVLVGPGGSRARLARRRRRERARPAARPARADG